MKRKLVSLLPARLLALPLASCSPSTGSGAPESERETAPAQVTVSMLYTSELSNFEALAEVTCPDIDLQNERNAKATIDGESKRCLRTSHDSGSITTSLPIGDV